MATSSSYVQGATTPLSPHVRPLDMMSLTQQSVSTGQCWAARKGSTGNKWYKPSKPGCEKKILPVVGFLTTAANEIIKDNFSGENVSTG